MRDWSEDNRQAMIRHYGLTQAMINALGTAQITPGHSGTVLGRQQAIEALRRRGMIADDNRWTTRGFHVAAVVLLGSTKTIDDLHVEAIEEDIDHEVALTKRQG